MTARGTDWSLALLVALLVATGLLTAFAGDQFDASALQSFADARAQDVKDVASVIIPSLQKVHDALTPEQQDALLGIARTMNAAIADEDCTPPDDCDD